LPSRSRTSWIRTVHGIGYSFAGDVHVTAAASASALFHYLIHKAP
jgi:DNA-binding winged helix-turn-helix (wHTH) protein